MKIIITLFSFLLVLTQFTGCSFKDDTPVYKSSQNLTQRSVNDANPLKGLYPYNGSYQFTGHSMEHLYFPFEQIVTSKDTYDFTALDAKIQKIADRGHHTVLRIYLDYPDKSEDEDGTPQWVYDLGVKKISYTRVTNGRTVEGNYPDFSDETLNAIILSFIKEFGSKYDNDSRIGFIEAGLIGHWGEWHTTDNISMPSANQKLKIFKAYRESFKNKKILARYPDDQGLADIPEMGFHDDSFTYSTIGEKSWYFYPKMKASLTTLRYKTAPIGGEFYPSNQLPWATETTDTLERFQSFEDCAKATRISFMKITSPFYNSNWNSLTEQQKQRLMKYSDSIGYNLTILSSQAEISVNQIKLNLKIKNTGLARFYYKWKIKVIILADDIEYDSFVTDWDITSILPDSEEKNFYVSHKLNLPENLDFSKVKVAVKVINPLANGVTFKFANAEMDKDKGWIITSSTFR